VEERRDGFFWRGLKTASTPHPPVLGPLSHAQPHDAFTHTRPTLTPRHRLHGGAEPEELGPGRSAQQLSFPSLSPGHTSHIAHTHSHTTMATRRQASLSAPSASNSSTNSATKKASFPQVPTAASTKLAYTASTNKAAAAAAAPVPLLPADMEDDQKGEMLAGTHYILKGPATGKLVVCVPGLGGPHWYFDELVPFLLQAGFRVLRYDLVGRGHSEPPPRTRRPSCFCIGVAREKDPYGTFVRLLCFLRGRDRLE